MKLPVKKINDPKKVEEIMKALHCKLKKIPNFVLIVVKIHSQIKNNKYEKKFTLHVNSGYSVFNTNN